MVARAYIVLAQLSGITSAVTEAETELRSGLMPSLVGIFAALIVIALGASAVHLLINKS